MEHQSLMQRPAAAMREGSGTDTAIAAPRQAEILAGFEAALQAVDHVVLKKYLTKLNQLDVVSLAPEWNVSLRPEDDANLSKDVRLFKITQMVYERDEFSAYKFASVFNALAALSCSVFVLIQSDGRKTDFYMGVRSQNSSHSTASLKETLKRALQGQFPGIQIPEKDLMNREMLQLLSRLPEDHISAVSCVANIRDEDIHDNDSFVQGLEKLVLAMQGQAYTGIILASGTSADQLSEMRRQYETIYTQLAPFAKTQISYLSNQAINFSLANTLGESFSDTTGETHSDSVTEGKSTSQSDTRSVSRPSAMSKVIAGLSAVATIISKDPLLGLAIGQAGTLFQKTTTEGHSYSESSSTSQSHSESHSTSHQEGTSRSQTDTKGISDSKGETLMLNMENKTISDMLERIDTQLKRIKECESLGMWNCAAYFLSDADNKYAAEIAASTYKALMRGENSGVEVSAVNSWAADYPEQRWKIPAIRDYLTHFMHPVFSCPLGNQRIEVTPCSLISGNELALHMGLPRKSVCGFPVTEHADFGKEVTYMGIPSARDSQPKPKSGNSENEKTDKEKEEKQPEPVFIRLGQIFNMGRETESRVHLNLESLSMHTFITGSTGVGKSNTIYELLRQLRAYGRHFMVVEPAKGEYKNVFGGWRDVSVFGTNPYYTDLLKINPFKFPRGIHVLEHIDRLIEIFNVCWPMYAAMPAVLKDALLQAYEVCGWDLDTSKNAFSQEIFPTFADLQEELVHVIQQSAYSEEVKSNYTGSLVTRVRSLTNGLNRQIFCADEIGDSRLFDSNVIVDLSRVGSLETKALIMGLLVMRLSEHRMTAADGMNQTLQHVTVLEEAHNILKRTSTEQNPEAPSMAGKSVEMLSNAIAEMRTYGEGFIIADQSPGAVDPSAIRNTNTKIIMRLPDEADRRTAGKAAALKDEQLDEIAKLGKGIAVVYQNDWLEPVLCKISKFDGTEKPLVFVPSEGQGKTDIEDLTVLLNFIGYKRLSHPSKLDEKRIAEAIVRCTCTGKTKATLYSLAEEYHASRSLHLWKEDISNKQNDSGNDHFGGQAALAVHLLGMEDAVNDVRQHSFDLWDFRWKLNTRVIRRIGPVSEDMLLLINHYLLKDYSVSGKGPNQFYEEWRKSMGS